MIAARPLAQFQFNGSRLLEVTISGDTFKALNGSIVAYDGGVTFKRQGVGDQGASAARCRSASRRAWASSRAEPSTPAVRENCVKIW